MTQDVVSIVKGNTRIDQLELFMKEITFGRRGDHTRGLQVWATHLCNR